MLLSTTSLTLSRAALAVAVLASLGGCCELSGLCGEAKSGTAGENTELNDSGGIVATDGCAVDSIETQNGGACASCTDPNNGDDARICGAVTVAPCNNQENAFGERCQRCETADGQVLYDDCPVSAEEVGAARCEQVAGDPSQPVDQTDSDCSVCYDDGGNVVSSACEPAHDECHDVVENDGRACRDCTLNGQVVVHDCEAIDIDPRECESYENELGRCVDCYDEQDQIVLHQCTLAGDQFVSCVETIDPSGLSCFQCVDQNGNMVESNCSTQVPTAQSCQLLEYSSQQCVVCVDDLGEAVLTECTATGCDPTDPNGCPATPACTSDRSPDGALCRTCFTDDTQTTSETRCISDLNLVCDVVSSGELPPDPGGGGNDPVAPPANDTCVFCSDVNTGAEVYRNCGAGQAPPPQPYCVDTVDEATQQVCTLCYDPATDAPLYSSCDNGDTCYVTGDRPLGDPNATDPNSTVATCYACGSANTSDATTFSSVCVLPQDCTGPDGFVDPNGGTCPTVGSLLLAPHECNGWDDANVAAHTEDELIAVLSWAQSTHGLALASIAAMSATIPAGQCDAQCGVCPRGDLLEVGITSDQDAQARDALADLLVGCQSDGDCPASALCLTGACGY